MRDAAELLSNASAAADGWDGEHSLVPLVPRLSLILRDALDAARLDTAVEQLGEDGAKATEAADVDILGRGLEDGDVGDGDGGGGFYTRSGSQSMATGKQKEYIPEDGTSVQLRSG